MGIESFHRLCQRLEADRASLAEGKPTCREMARRYGDQMGMELSPHTLRRAKIACDMTWKAPKARGADRSSRPRRRRMVNHDIRVLADAILAMRDGRTMDRAAVMDVIYRRTNKEDGR